MARTPKWIRRQRRRFRGSRAQDRDLRWLWRHREHRADWIAEVIHGDIIFNP